MQAVRPTVSGPGIAERHKGERVRRISLALLIAVLGCLALAPGARAAAPDIINDASDLRWLETKLIPGAGGSGMRVSVTLVVKHDVGQSVDAIHYDTNWNNVADTTTAVTPQKPSGNFNYSRVSFTYTPSTDGVGFSCPVIGTRTRRVDRTLAIRARTTDGQFTETLSGSVRLVANGTCIGSTDFAYLYDQSQNKTSVVPGESIQFQFRGDDYDDTGDGNNFGGINWRWRRLSDGAVINMGLVCYGNNENNLLTLNTTAPSRRGRWVAEAELRNPDSSCSLNDNPGHFARLGAIDVNTAATSSPDGTIDGVPARPIVNQTFTATANVNDSDDSGEGGKVQWIEWDADGNGVYERREYGNNEATSALTTAQLQQSINTTGMAPGTYTVRAQIHDNGAINGADTIRRSRVITDTFTVNTSPVANNTNYLTETEQAVGVTLGGPSGATDANNDPLTYTITDPPDNGTLSGTGANRTYTPNSGFAGDDSFTIQVTDGFGGADTAVVSVRVEPNTGATGPTGTINSRGADIGFSSAATGATFQCSLDNAAFISCGSSPKEYRDLADGQHNVRVRAVVGNFTDSTPAGVTWTVDAFPAIDITSGPDPETDEIDATFAFTTSEAGTTVDPVTHCKLDDRDFRPCDSPETYTDVDDGDHTLTVRATDAYGKQATDTYEWSVDAIGSNTLIDAAPARVTKSQMADFEFSSPDPDAVFACKLDDAADYSPCDSPENFTDLAEGRHVFRVRAIDTVGNIDPTPATWAWRIDLTKPVASIDRTPPTPTNDNTPTFEFSADERATFECRVNDGTDPAFSSCASPLTTSTLPDGDYSFQVQATDAADNVGDPVSFGPFTVDTTEPATQIGNGPAEGSTVGDTTAVFEFTSPDSSAIFQCKIDGGVWALCASPKTYQGLRDGPHDFSVRAVDEADNRDPSPPTRSWSIDSTPPQTTITRGPSGSVRTAEASFEFAADDSAAHFECRLDSDAPGDFAPCTSPFGTGSLPDGQHKFEVRSLDPLDNVDRTPASRTWTIDTSPLPPPDEPPPPPREKPCTFDNRDEDCGRPYLEADVRSSEPRPDRRRNSPAVDLVADGGGAFLRRAQFRIPDALTVKPLSFFRGRRVGYVEIFRPGERKRRVPLTLRGNKPFVLSEADPRVTVSPASGQIRIGDLPPETTLVRLHLKGSTGLITAVRRCVTVRWHARLTDTAGNSVRQVTVTDSTCVRRSRGR